MLDGVVPVRASERAGGFRASGPAPDERLARRRPDAWFDQGAQALKEKGGTVYSSPGERLQGPPVQAPTKMSITKGGVRAVKELSAATLPLLPGEWVRPSALQESLHGEVGPLRAHGQVVIRLDDSVDHVGSMPGSPQCGSRYV